MGDKDSQELLAFHQAVDFVLKRPFGKKMIVRNSKKGIERSRAFFALINNPQDTFKSIHLAGTSGKGTVAYMLESLLQARAKKTGAHTSPHVYDIRERCRIDGSLPEEDVFVDIVNRLRHPIHHMEQSKFGSPSYFEIMNAVAFCLFSSQSIDYGVIETGVGGLYDSTNTISRSDKLAVITKLGLDHTEILGSSLDKIAYQKAGIIPKNGYAIVWKPEDLLARNVIESQSQKVGARLEYVDETLFTIVDSSPSGLTIDYHDDKITIKNITLPPGGVFQAENATVAIRSLRYIAERDQFDLSTAAVVASLQEVSIPARSEKIHLFDRTVIFDGAHNPQKMAAFTDTMRNEIHKPIFVVALKKTKNPSELLKQIKPHADKLIVTQFFTQQDDVLKNFSYSAEELARIAEELDVDAIKYDDSLQALIAACTLSAPTQTVVVTGSFYFLGELKDKLTSHGIL